MQTQPRSPVETTTVPAWLRYWLTGAIALSSLSLSAGAGLALPGQSAADAAAWIRGNDTLAPAPHETLRVHRVDTAAQRFTFQASQSPPGRLVPPPTPGIIRTETFELFDLINGVSRDRLENSLRAIYGSDIYQDYRFAEIVYSYPVVGRVLRPDGRRGELRRGERYAYWVETATNADGSTEIGQMTVLLLADLDTLTAFLQARSPAPRF